VTKLIASILVNSILLRSTGSSGLAAPSADALLLEDGASFLLLESGSKLLLE